MLNPSLQQLLTDRQPTLWVNPGTSTTEERFDPAKVDEAAERMQRAGPLLAQRIEGLDESGIIESPLLSAESLRQALDGQGKWLLKADHRMPLAGSVKARGGFHEVLAYAEEVALSGGWDGQDFSALAADAWRRRFAQHRLIVGSTGNLGISIGLLSRALGFQAQVHMSRDASDWKKELLRHVEAEVVEHEGDYADAVQAGRAEAKADPAAHFVDDEASELLFAGYAVAGRRVAAQLAEQRIEVSKDRPLIVYLPCGVGGAPGGISYGLKQEFGDAVHCWFAEPVDSPSMLLQMAVGIESPMSVYDIGLSNDTLADGLAVAQASMLAAASMQQRLAGVFTVSDDQLPPFMRLARDLMDEKLEPSATAGFAGPGWLATSEAGKQWCAEQKVDLDRATHVLWSTGGGLVPEATFKHWLNE